MMKKRIYIVPCTEQLQVEMEVLAGIKTGSGGGYQEQARAPRRDSIRF